MQSGRVVITGADGFVGRNLVDALHKADIPVRRVVRRASGPRAKGEDVVAIGDLADYDRWRDLLQEASVVVHLAARVHVHDRRAAQEDRLFERVNTLATRQLAEAAAERGVRRFVFMSTVAVHGIRSTDVVSESTEPAPVSAYARSKWQAEQCLQRIASQSDTDFVVLRPPMVYGAGNPGNMARLMKLIDMGLPLPFASVHNARSLLYVGNLVDAIIRIVREPGTVGEAFLVSDAEVLSTPELIRQIGVAARRRVRLLPFPPEMLRMLMRCAGRGREASSLLDSLVIDANRIRHRLGWQPPFDACAGLAQMASWWATRRG